MENNVGSGSVLATLTRCKPVVDAAYPLQCEIISLHSQIDTLNAKSGRIQNLFRIKIWMYIAACVVLLLLRPVLCVGVIVFAFIYQNKWKKNEVLKEEVSKLPELAVTVSEKEDRLRRLFRSEEGQFALQNVPRDYFYPNAVDRFIFYLTNGHADTMKEALQQYDEYVHKCKMEYEAARAADANERAADAAERTADASERSARNSAAIRSSVETIEQYSANVSFWATYNGIFK